MRKTFYTLYVGLSIAILCYLIIENNKKTKTDKNNKFNEIKQQINDILKEINNIEYYLCNNLNQTNNIITKDNTLYNHQLYRTNCVVDFKGKQTENRNWYIYITQQNKDIKQAYNLMEHNLIGGNEHFYIKKVKQFNKIFEFNNIPTYSTYDYLLYPKIYDKFRTLKPKLNNDKTITPLFAKTLDDFKKEGFVSSPNDIEKNKDFDFNYFGSETNENDTNINISFIDTNVENIDDYIMTKFKQLSIISSGNMLDKNITNKLSQLKEYKYVKQDCSRNKLKEYVIKFPNSINDLQNIINNP